MKNESVKSTVQRRLRAPMSSARKLATIPQSGSVHNAILRSTLTIGQHAAMPIKAEAPLTAAEPSDFVRDIVGLGSGLGVSLCIVRTGSPYLRARLCLWQRS